MNHGSRTRLLLRRVALTLAALAVLVVSPARTASVSQAGPPSESLERTTVLLPLFLEGGGYRSVLTVNNNRPEPVQTEVEIFGPGGRSSLRTALEIPPLTAVERPLGALLPGSVPFGSLELRYRGLPREVTAQVTVSSVARRVSFESVEAHRAHSSKAHAIVWLPHSGARATVALTNRSEGPLATVLTEVGSGRLSVVRLQSRETRLIGATRFGREDRGGEPRS